MREILTLSEKPKDKQIVESYYCCFDPFKSYMEIDEDEIRVLEEIDGIFIEKNGNMLPHPDFLSYGCKMVLNYLRMMKNKEIYPFDAINVGKMGIYALECLMKQMDRLKDNHTVLFRLTPSPDMTNATKLNTCKEHYLNEYITDEQYYYGNYLGYVIPDTERIMLIRSVIFLGGSVKSGKTYVLNELKERKENSEYKIHYYDIKAMSQRDSEELLSRICDSITNSEDTIYLIDNITYSRAAEAEVEKICETAYHNRMTSTRVIFAGNRYILCSWANRFLFDKEGFVPLDYMKAQIWTSFKGKTLSREAFEEYLYTIDEFHGITDIRKYLDCCLEEARIAEKNLAATVYYNDTYGLTANFLFNVLCSVLIRTHDDIDADTLFTIDLFETGAEFKLTGLKADMIIKHRLHTILRRKDELFMKCSEERFKRALFFLYRSGIITIEYTAENANDMSELLKDFDKHNKHTSFKNRYYVDYKVKLKHPVFFTALIKGLIPE